MRVILLIVALVGIGLGRAPARQGQRRRPPSNSIGADS